MNNPKIRIIISTIREGRFGDKPARWIFDIASGREGLDFEIVDLRDYPLSHLREHPPDRPRNLALERGSWTSWTEISSSQPNTTTACRGC